MDKDNIYSNSKYLTPTYKYKTRVSRFKIKDSGL